MGDPTSDPTMSLNGYQFKILVMTQFLYMFMLLILIIVVGTIKYDTGKMIPSKIAVTPRSSEQNK